MNRVLVLMSTYNGEKYLREQVESILEQKDVDIFLLIRDDGSSDTTPIIAKDLANKNPNIEFICAQNVGAAYSFCELMRIARSRVDSFDFYAFSDQDDIWLPEKLSEACRKIKELPQDKPALYFSNLYITREEICQKDMMYERNLPINKSHLLVENFASGCTVLFNSLTLLTFLDHPINNLQMHDLRLIHMCMLLGNIVYDSNSYIYYRQHSGNAIGANYYLRQRLNSKMKSLTNFWKQHCREEEAKEVLFSYGQLLNDEDRKIVTIVANYRNNLKYRMLMFFSPGHYDYNMRKKTDNLWLKIRVLIGAV